MNYLNQINIEPRKIFNFDNYYNDQSEIRDLEMLTEKGVTSSLIISGSNGSGVTHLLNALCNRLNAQNKTVMYITAQWLLNIGKTIKTENELELFCEYLDKFDVIAIDNIQFIYRKALRQSKFILDIITFRNNSNKLIFLGCSDLNKDITKSKKLVNRINLKRIELRELSTYDVFRALKQLCSLEDNLPDMLLYAISGYNGMIQQHINCLISIRFNSEIKKHNLDQMTLDEFDKLFNLKKYFPSQQFRKCFNQTQLDFVNKFERVKII